MNLRDFSLSTALALLVCLTGCGEEAPPTGEVTGMVTYQGKPLSEGTITFIPQGGRPGYGKIVDGVITEVSTHEPNDGAPLGPNQVTIQAMANANDMYAPAKSLIPEHYASPDKSGLTANIQADETNDLKFDLQ